MSASRPAAGTPLVSLADLDAAGGGPMRVIAAGRAWVVVRLGSRVAAFADLCPHRLASLSAGRVVDGTLECAYHGWRFAADGRCMAIPSLGPGAHLPPRACLDELPVALSDGAVVTRPCPRA